MSSPVSIVDFQAFGVQVTPKTTWVFLNATDDAGRVGVGEASINADSAVVDVAKRYHGVVTAGPMKIDELEGALPFGTKPEAAFSSALIAAAMDLLGQAEGIPLSSMLGGTQRSAIRAYANINRRTTDRTPHGFALSAKAAQEAGFDAFKIASFDGLLPAMTLAEARPYLDAGIAAAEAVRTEIGDAARLMIDCHWRMNAETAAWAIDALAATKLHWLECPVPENADALDLLKSLRAQVNDQGVLLAGCESETLIAGFRPFLDVGAYDVMMPDVQYAGGPAEMMRIAQVFADHGVGFSPHNPKGPIAHAHALHISAAVKDFHMLEVQFDETPLFSQLVGDAVPDVRESAFPALTSPGLGITIDQAVASGLKVTAAFPERH
ncbi:MAG: enolase C-terminal domain-like protein [Alphaproteobacteria bacterium]